MSEPWQWDIHWFHALQNLNPAVPLWIPPPSSSHPVAIQPALLRAAHLESGLAIWGFRLTTAALHDQETGTFCMALQGNCREPGASKSQHHVWWVCLQYITRLLQDYQFECNWTTDWGACAQCMNLLGCLQPFNYSIILQYHQFPLTPIKFGLEWNWPYFE